MHKDFEKNNHDLASYCKRTENESATTTLECLGTLRNTRHATTFECRNAQVSSLGPTTTLECRRIEL